MTQAKRSRKGKVVGLYGGIPAGVARVDPDVVQQLQAMLTLAKDGELVGMVYGYVRASGDIVTGWNGKPSQHVMSSAAAQLNHRIQNVTIENNE